MALVVAGLLTLLLPLPSRGSFSRSPGSCSFAEGVVQTRKAGADISDDHGQGARTNASGASSAGIGAAAGASLPAEVRSPGEASGWGDRGPGDSKTGHGVGGHAVAMAVAE